MSNRICLSLIVLFLFLFTFRLQGQTENISVLSTADSALLKSFDSLCVAIQQSIDSGEYAYYRLNSAENVQKRIEEFGQKQNVLFRKMRLDYLNRKLKSVTETNRIVGNVIDVLIRLENSSGEYSYDRLSNTSTGIIQSISQINMLEILLRSVEDHEVNDVQPGKGMSSVLKQKLIRAISLQINVLAQKEYVWYNYATDKKQAFLAFNVSTANDLFTPVGLGEQFGLVHPNPNQKFFFQSNDDRDYTGGVCLEVATHYLKMRRTRPVKSYQTIFWGGDFYSPYFRDTANKFPRPDSYNTLDRPFASFQYLGYSTHCLSRNNELRWDWSFAFGKIGGKRGQVLQSVLHQDVSYSPRPMGWDAQIANGGRLGFSIQYKPEYQFFTHSRMYHNPKQRHLYISAIADLMFGTFMTYGSGGFQLANKDFKSVNTSNAVQRNSHTIKREKKLKFPYLYWNLRISYRRLVHNSMLEGYGVTYTTEPKPWEQTRRDPLTPYSLYFLKSEEVIRDLCLIDLTVSKQARYFTFFYRFSMISPETTFGDIGIKVPGTNENFNISGRWHHWATIGVCFRAY